MKKRLKHEVIRIPTSSGSMKAILLRPEHPEGIIPAILWIHGGGYETGMSEMVYFSCARILAERFGAVVLAPEYRLSGESPYPAALDDCYDALKYLYEHLQEYGADPQRLIVGGESAGGGLTSALCLKARDEGQIPVCFHLPLYPMLDCLDTESSRDNHGYIWNTRRNRRAWRKYLGEILPSREVSCYASPSRAEDLSGMPPAYTYVQDGEPFYDETLEYIRRLNEAGIPARVDVYHGKMHGFDLLMPWTAKSRLAHQRLCEAYERVVIKGEQL